MEKKDFLTLVSAKRLKREIRNICNSYSHQWDIIAELTQNSLDSIKRWNKQNPKIKREHKIQIDIDQKRKEIIISDTGIGIDPDKLPLLLTPNETDKEGNEPYLIGEKGVGLKFAIFSSNKFVLETESKSGGYNCEINGAREWRDNEDYDADKIPKVDELNIHNKTNPPIETGTKIILTDLEDLGNFFELDFERVAYLLRTKTAIGYTGKKFDRADLEIDVTLKIKDKDGSIKNAKVPFEYAFPDGFFEKRDIVDIDEFIKKAADLSDKRKHTILNEKCMISIGKNDQAGKTVYYYAFFVPSREAWAKIAIKAKLCEDCNNEDKDQIGSDVKPGIFISTRSMPTGIELTPPITGVMGYWANIFILIEYDNFSFDLGRKTIPGRSQGLIKEIAKKQFGKFSKWKQFAVKTSEKSPDLKISAIVNIEKNNQIKEFKKLPDLNIDKINFLKQPGNQEAGVAAIFHELIGAGIIKGYRCLSAGYKHDYDFWGIYKINKSQLGEKIRLNASIPEDIEIPIVIEFKSDACNMIPDVEGNRKHFEDIDLIVCWDINEESFSKEGISVEPCDPEDVFWFGSNFKLIWPSTLDLGNNAIKHVISIRRFIEDLKKESD